jgi:hypothetical protein
VPSFITSDVKNITNRYLICHCSLHQEHLCAKFLKMTSVLVVPSELNFIMLKVTDHQFKDFLDDRGSRVRFPAGAGNFSRHHRVQNGSGTHKASYPMGTRGSFPGVKAAGA